MELVELVIGGVQVLLQGGRQRRDLEVGAAVAERVLGLPAEPRADADLPFGQLPASGTSGG